jgi:hypothetical protein
MRNLLLAFLLVPSLAYSAPYIELGIAKGDGASCILDKESLICSSSPLGNATIGYEWRGFHLEAEHWSSLQDRDYGLNLFTFKYRYTFK